MMSEARTPQGPDLPVGCDEPKLETMACHLVRLWIRHNGDLHCCYRWAYESMKIAHITDDDVLDSIRSFYGSCSCEKYILRAAAPGEELQIQELVVELSLACQGDCAFCCVKPHGRVAAYKYYPALTKMIDLLKPKLIVVQGGEVLIQKDALEWVAQIRDRHPEMAISLITNGNRSLDMVEVVERLFDEVTVSTYGFEPATYERVSEMKLEKVVRFCDELARRRRLPFVLKFVVSPLSFFEADVFLDWAIDKEPTFIFFEDADTALYLNMEMPGGFWQKISDRTGRKVVSMLLKKKDKLLSSDTTIHFSHQSQEILGLNADRTEPLKANGLDEKLRLYWAVGETPIEVTEA